MFIEKVQVRVKISGEDILNTACFSAAKPPVQVLFLLCCSAKPLLGHHALVWLLGFRMAGFMLSGSGIRVFVLGNMGLGWGGWGKVQVNDGGGCGVVGMGCGGGRGGGVYCLLEVPD